MKTKLFTLALAALTIGLLGSCKKEDPKVSVTGVTLDQTELTLTVGDDDVKLVATIAPENATDKTVSWSSDKTEFATVDTEGNVHAVAPGTANITVTTTDGGKTATCAVTVKAALPEGALPSVFSVSATKKVHFSQGNLYWDGNAFKFETNQYDVPKNWSTSHVGHFYWSKSASVAYAEIYNETGISESDVLFTNATETTAKADFTVNDVTGQYRTLSADEWEYLFDTRTVNEGTGEDKSYSLEITYGDIMGIVIYPDNYTGSALSGTVTTLPEGVVFLPKADYRVESSIRSDGSYLEYNSSSTYDNERVYVVDFYKILFPPSTYFNVFEPKQNVTRDNGRNIRLVTDVK